MEFLAVFIEVDRLGGLNWSCNTKDMQNRLDELMGLKQIKNEAWVEFGFELNSLFNSLTSNHLQSRIY